MFASIAVVTGIVHNYKGKRPTVLLDKSLSV